MTLDALKAKLQVVGSSGIQEVFFDWHEYLAERIPQYPSLLWMIDGAEFTTDMRSDVDRKTKPIKLTMYIMNKFEIGDVKTTSWDGIESKIATYLNALNEDNSLEIKNIDNVKGKYFGKGMITPESEVGIRFEIDLVMHC